VAGRNYRRSKPLAAMRVFVLGAGASHDAGYPLAAKLGEELKNWANSPPLSEKEPHRECLAQIAGSYETLDNFETILSGLMTCSPGSQAAAVRSAHPSILTDLQEAIRAYFDWIRSRSFPRVPRYDEFAGILRDGDLVITFNYDLGIERALRTCKLWDIGSGYGFRVVTAECVVEVLKLHGSTNWRALLAGGRTGLSAVNGNSLGNRPVLWSRSDLKYLDCQNFVDPLCLHLDSAATLPTLIMPALPKTFHFETPFGNEWEGFWDRLWQRAGCAIERADELVIIGYSLPQEDERARDLLLGSANKAVRLTICCGHDTPKLELEFRQHGFNEVRQTGGENKFEDFLALAAEEDGARADGLISRTGDQERTSWNACLPADPDDSVIPLESDEIKRESIDKQVFIFNVGPLSHARPMSSYGTITIPALEASSYLHSDLRVAGPVTIPGRPSECYPDPFSEKWRRLYHQPIDGTPPGIDFALQVIGADRRGAMSGDLRSEGVFISQVRVPSKKHILRAQRRLRETAQARCEYLSQRSEAGDRVPITERDRIFARLLNYNARWVQAYDAQS
jgi:hypothetical protein